MERNLSSESNMSQASQKNFPCFMVHEGLFPFSEPLLLLLSRGRSIQSTPSQPISWGLISIFYHLSLRLPNGLFSLVVPTKTLYVPFLPSYLPHSIQPFHYSWFGHHPSNIWWEKSLRYSICTIPSPLLVRRCLANIPSSASLLEHPHPIISILRDQVL